MTVAMTLQDLPALNATLNTVATCFLVTGLVMIKTGRLNESIQFVEEGLELSDELNLKPHLGHFKGSMGYILSRRGRYDEANDYFLQTEQLVEEIDDKVLEIHLMLYRAELSFQIGDTMKGFMKSLVKGDTPPQSLMPASRYAPAPSAFRFGGA